MLERDNNGKKNKRILVTSQYPDAASFPIVGLGASAGGLAACEEFFKALPANSGMAFVVISHLDPTHVSILPELIQRYAKVKVFVAADGMPVQPDSVYVIPINCDLAIVNGRLQVMAQNRPRGCRLPIDTFFCSLAQDQGANAIGIILSGTGSDGTLGVKAIKAEFGMVMVQEPTSAKYDGMPQSAIATQQVDFVLPAAEMPAQLLRYTQHRILPSAKASAAGEEVQEALPKIFYLLRSQTGHDFSLYKKNTICRRIERRMHVLQIDAISEYVRYLQQSKVEIGILFKDLLIGVTNFFRDPAAYDVLKEKYLPALLRDKPQDYTLRVWVPACSSGEEVYSTAILLLECMDELNLHYSIQLFGTDLDEEAINTARAGIYPASIANDVNPQRLARFFYRDGKHYRIKKNVRELVIFAVQNLIKDPPFSRLDLLSCRNLLIYFGPELQQRVLAVFHYSLKPDGLLLLGSSESIGKATDYFLPLDKKLKIFRRRAATEGLYPGGLLPAPPLEVHEMTVQQTAKNFKEPDVLRLVETLLQQIESPPCVIIDSASNIQYIHGRTGKYLEPPVGKASLNLLEMARSGLKGELTVAIRQASGTKKEVKRSGLCIEDEGAQSCFDLTVKPIQEQGSMQGLLVVIFTEAAASSGANPGTKDKAVKRSAKNREVMALERELQYVRESLQTTIEELETSNEELKSANEELQSTNEELQSTNEELGTSKEELQSLNEESVTVNVELQSRIEELSATNDDLKNLLDSTNVATIFLDSELHVRRFTPKATAIIPLTASDVGRPVSHFVAKLKENRLEEHATQVLHDLVPQEVEVEGRDGDFFRLRVLPYRTINNVVDGVVMTFEDISKSKIAEQALQDSEKKYRELFESLRDGCARFDGSGRIVESNRVFQQQLGYNAEELARLNFRDLTPEKWHAKEELAAADDLAQRGYTSLFEKEYIRKDGTVLPVEVQVYVVSDEPSPARWMIVRDISARKALEEKLRKIQPD
ncbi:MAG TPA: chemotaxis protein CheB [Malonomonas sp.]